MTKQPDVRMQSGLAKNRMLLYVPDSKAHLLEELLERVSDSDASSLSAAVLYVIERWLKGKGSRAEAPHHPGLNRFFEVIGALATGDQKIEDKQALFERAIDLFLDTFVTLVAGRVRTEFVRDYLRPAMKALGTEAVAALEEVAKRRNATSVEQEVTLVKESMTELVELLGEGALDLLHYVNKGGQDEGTANGEGPP